MQDPVTDLFLSNNNDNMSNGGGDDDDDHIYFDQQLQNPTSYSSTIYHSETATDDVLQELLSPRDVFAFLSDSSHYPWVPASSVSSNELQDALDAFSQSQSHSQILESPAIDSVSDLLPPLPCTESNQDQRLQSIDSSARHLSISSSVSSSAPTDQQPLAPRRRTRRRQNISCDQCRASKRGCDFQLKLDAAGNHNTDTPGNKRKANSLSDTLLPKSVCSNCQRRGIECTTVFADSVRSSKQATNQAEVPASAATKKRAPSNASLTDRGRSLGSLPAADESSCQSTLASSHHQQRSNQLVLSWNGANTRFANRADSLLLTTNRMHLYVHTVEPNANLWLSRACSPIRSQGDIGAYVKSAIGADSLRLSQKLWASWHVDVPSTHRDHQPNLFYLVYGLDHLGGELGVWGENPQTTTVPIQSPTANLDQESLASLNGFYEQMKELTGNGPGGWRRTKRDLMIDEAVKATMLAYACQFRLDDDANAFANSLPTQARVKPNDAQDAHDRIATAAWKRARSLILQLAPRRSCRVAYGLFLFGVTAPPMGAIAQGGSNSAADAAEDAAFAFETASRHLEWFVKQCRDLVQTVEQATKNPLLACNPEMIRHKQITSDLMGLAESLGWFGLLIDTVASVSQRRKSILREDSLVNRDNTIAATPTLGVSPTSSAHPNPSLDQTTAALFAIQDTINLLPSLQVPPGAFPGTSSFYMHDQTDEESGLEVDTEMSRRIMERAACARDLISALLENPGALANAIPFDALIRGDPETGNPHASLLNFNGSPKLNEQVVLLGVAWGTAMEVYIWRRVGVLQTASKSLLSATSPLVALVKGGGFFVSDKDERLMTNILEAIRLFHSIFDGLISRALDEFVHLGRQARTMLSFFVIHIHLGVLHFIRLAKEIEQKEIEMVQQYNAMMSSSPCIDMFDNLTVISEASPLANTSPSASFLHSPGNNATESSSGFEPVGSRMAASSMERRKVGRQAAQGIARIAELINAESIRLEQAGPVPPNTRREPTSRNPSFYRDSDIPNPIQDSANAPWRHPYPVMVADALKLAAQQLHDEIWEQLLIIPRNNDEYLQIMRHFNSCLDGLTRLLHAVPGLGGYRTTLDELKSARNTAQFVATQQ